jgi:hypothetical protein
MVGLFNFRSSARSQQGSEAAPSVSSLGSDGRSNLSNSLHRFGHRLPPPSVSVHTGAASGASSRRIKLKSILKSNNDNGGNRTSGAAAAGCDASVQSGGTGRTSTNNRRRVHHHVGFGTVEVREYARTVGDNPSVSSGPPISYVLCTLQHGWCMRFLFSNSILLLITTFSLDWEYYPDAPIYALNDFEATQSKYRRTEKEMALPRPIREDLLRLEWNVTPASMAKAVREVIKVKNQRRQTIHHQQSGWHKLDQTMERSESALFRSWLGRNSDPTTAQAIQLEHQHRQYLELEKHNQAAQQRTTATAASASVQGASSPHPHHFDTTPNPLDEDFDYAQYYLQQQSIRPPLPASYHSSSNYGDEPPTASASADAPWESFSAPLAPRYQRPPGGPISARSLGAGSTAAPYRRTPPPSSSRPQPPPPLATSSSLSSAAAAGGAALDEAKLAELAAKLWSSAAVKRTTAIVGEAVDDDDDEDYDEDDDFLDPDSYYHPRFSKFLAEDMDLMSEISR